MPAMSAVFVNFPFMTGASADVDMLRDAAAMVLNNVYAAMRPWLATTSTFSKISSLRATAV